MLRNHERSSALGNVAVAACLKASADAAGRDEIVKTAARHFVEHGYEGTSMEVVARCAGVSETTIYDHFTDKREMFRAIIKYCYNKVSMPESFLSEANLPAEKALLKIAGQFMSRIYLMDAILMIRAVQAEAMRNPEIALIYFEAGQRPIKSAFANLLREFNRQGQLSVPDPIRAAEQFFCLLTGEMLQKILALPALRPDSEELETRIKTTVDLFLAYYRPHPPMNQDR